MLRCSIYIVFCRLSSFFDSVPGTIASFQQHPEAARGVYKMAKIRHS